MIRKGKRYTNIKNLLIELKDFIHILRSQLNNKELLDYIISKLIVCENEGSIRTLNECYLESYDYKTGDSFTIELDDTLIKTSFVCWNGHHHEKIEIYFNDDGITVNRDESTNFVRGSTYVPSSTLRKSTTAFYKDNQLIYFKEIDITTEDDLNNFHNYSRSSETFIDEYSQAVRRETVINNTESPSIHSTKYYKSSSCNVPPFDTVNCSNSEFTLNMDESTEEEFNSFLSSYKNQETLKLIKSQ